MKHLSIDIETYSSVDITKQGLYKYVGSDDFEILLFSYAADFGDVVTVDLAKGEVIPPEIILALEDREVIKHAYNATFEWCALNRRVWPTPISQWRCTMLHGLYLGYPAGLEAVGDALGIASDAKKMKQGKALVKYFSSPCKPTRANGGRVRNLPEHDPEKWELYKQYNRQDVVAEMEILKKIEPFPVPAREQALWVLDAAINTAGIKIDRAFVTKIIELDTKNREKLMETAKNITKLDNPNSARQLMAWLEDNDAGLANLQKATVESAISISDGDVKEVLKLKSQLSKTSIKKYYTMLETVCDDGRIRGLLQFYGANKTGRWAGRLVQVHNLKRNDLPGLDLARQLAAEGRTDDLEFLYEDLSDVFSQLTRTAFIPAEGKKFIVADFSAIEARVLAWLAGEEWVLNVFRTHGKIYEAQASQMFGVDMRRIAKGNPEYSLRQKGKIATLALGYQGGVNALIAMGADKMGLSENEMQEIVTRFRNANKNIAKLWRDLEDGCLYTLETGMPTPVGYLICSVEMKNGLRFLSITLPSGRKLYYPEPSIKQNRFGRQALAFKTVNKTTFKWGVEDTYGGKLVENCLAADTLVLTRRGWLPIVAVATTDQVWDGETWVAHEGLIFKGTKQTITLNGTRLTPDHKILTLEGWASASSCEKHNWNEVKIPDRLGIPRLRREKITVENSMRLRKNNRHARQRIHEAETIILRLSESRVDKTVEDYSRDVKTPGVCRMALNESPLHSASAPGLAQLRGPGHQSMRTMVGEFREFLGRHGALIRKRSFYRSNRQQRRLRTEKLPLGFSQDAKPKQTNEHHNQHAVGAHDYIRSSGTVGNQCKHTLLPVSPPMSEKVFILSGGCYEPVYDLTNAGPRHRFTILTDSGPVVVHNCTQAVARDCLAHSIALVANGLHEQIVMHVHDEIVVETGPETSADDICRVMGKPIPWAKTLPLNAAGFETQFYKKD